ncbi:hypothetical protein OJAV_G00175670 [Oryzias javanicus]|uniref:Uncharacterized protein n=1 Tax=Oryzias javanicus TaxID=123683 RepID=A0A437CFV4_ORYJA|nr:hypothetical protein OJAV_G00175670 [Oryzias javanicus]
MQFYPDCIPPLVQRETGFSQLLEEKEEPQNTKKQSAAVGSLGVVRGETPAVPVFEVQLLGATRMSS